MGTIEVELTLNQIRDDLKSRVDGLHEVRSVTFIDANGAGIKIVISCDKERHPLKDWNKATFVDTGISLMSLTLPKAKQMTIDKFKSSVVKVTKGKKGKQAQKSQKSIIEEIEDEELSEELEA